MAVDLFDWFTSQNPNDSNVLLSLTEGVVLEEGDTVDTYNNTDVILGAGEDGDNKAVTGRPGETGVNIEGSLYMGNATASMQPLAALAVAGRS